MDPEAFWRATPRTFVAIMEGRAQAAEQRYELMLAGAWNAEALARTKRLKPLNEYVRPAKAKAARQSPSGVMAMMLEMQAGGVPMRIETVEIVQ